MRSPKYLRLRGLRPRPIFRTVSGRHEIRTPSVRSIVPRLRCLLAASLAVAPFAVAAGQTGGAPEARPVVGLHDSIDVATLEFDGSGGGVAGRSQARRVHAHVELPAALPRAPLQADADVSFSGTGVARPPPRSARTSPSCASTTGSADSARRRWTRCSCRRSAGWRWRSASSRESRRASARWTSRSARRC